MGWRSGLEIEMKMGKLGLEIWFRGLGGCQGNLGIFWIVDKFDWVLRGVTDFG